MFGRRRKEQEEEHVGVAQRSGGCCSFRVPSLYFILVGVERLSFKPVKELAEDVPRSGELCNPASSHLTCRRQFCFNVFIAGASAPEIMWTSCGRPSFHHQVSVTQVTGPAKTVCDAP